MVKKKSEHYVNNKELLEALIVYRAKVAAAAAETALSSGPAVGQQCHENIREKLLLLKEK